MKEAQRKIIDGKIYYECGNRRTIHEAGLSLGWREVLKNGEWKKIDTEPRWFIGAMAWVQDQ